MEDDAFILFGWESITRDKFGPEAETVLEQHRDRLYELDEDEMQKYIWRGLQEAAGKEGAGGFATNH